jgi:hypothetical protein
MTTHTLKSNLSKSAILASPGRLLTKSALSPSLTLLRGRPGVQDLDIVVIQTLDGLTIEGQIRIISDSITFNLTES